jgi:Xaa-Pro dipeptidase
LASRFQTLNAKLQLTPAADVAWGGYSLAERDRRWRAVRERAAQAGFDCVFVPPTIDPASQLSPETARGTRADCRFLTDMDVAAVALPTTGAPPIVINERGTGNHWITEPWAGSAGGRRGSWAPAMIAALRELGMERARIGVSGLKGGKVTHTRALDGLVNHGPYQAVVQALPNARFEDATDVVGFARYVKSHEEIECLRRGAAIAEAGVEELVRVARPGVNEAFVYSRVMTRVLELGSEYYPTALTIGPHDQEGTRFIEPQVERTLQPMQLITDEVDAVWGGIVAQEDQPILLGDLPDAWKPVVECQGALFEAGLEHMKPGTTFGEFIDFINGFGESYGPGLKTLILMHGRGYGNDGPLLTPRARGAGIRDVRFEANTAWVFKPYAMSADDRIQFAWGGDVIVTDKGGQKLFQRPHGMVCNP